MPNPVIRIDVFIPLMAKNGKFLKEFCSYTSIDPSEVKGREISSGSVYIPLDEEIIYKIGYNGIEFSLPNGGMAFFYYYMIRSIEIVHGEEYMTETLRKIFSEIKRHIALPEWKFVDPDTIEKRKLNAMIELLKERKESRGI